MLFYLIKNINLNDLEKPEKDLEKTWKKPGISFLKTPGNPVNCLKMTVRVNCNNTLTCSGSRQKKLTPSFANCNCSQMDRIAICR